MEEKFILIVATMSQTLSQYVYYQIKPFKDNELGVGYWEKVIKNLISLKTKKISFMIMGNMAEIKLFVKLPRDFQSYFKNTFYTTFTTSDLIEVEKIPLGEGRKFLWISEWGLLKTKEEFTRDGSYLDPMNEIFAVFQNVDKDSVLKICFEYTFKIEEDDLTKFLNGVGKVISYMRNSGKKAEEKPEEKKTEVNLFMNMRWQIQGNDPYVKENVGMTLWSVFAPFLSKGSWEKKEKAVWTPVNFSQVINLFHIPTKNNFVKGLDYTVYRKLPYPTLIPTPENTPERELTLIGDTDYRGQKIRFWIREEDKFRHIYIVGKTGTGKSTFINNRKLTLFAWSSWWTSRWSPGIYPSKPYQWCDPLWCLRCGISNRIQPFASWQRNRKKQTRLWSSSNFSKTLWKLMGTKTRIYSEKCSTLYHWLPKCNTHAYFKSTNRQGISWWGH